MLIALALKVEEVGDSHRAVALVRQAMDYTEKIGDPGALAFIRIILGIRLLGCGEREEAQRVLEAALAEQESAGVPAGVAMCHHDLGWIALGEGDLAGAKAHFERALDAGRHEAVGLTLKVHFLAAAAPVAARMGEPERAGALAAEAVAGARVLRLRRILVMALVRAAETAALTGDHDRARELVRELLAVLAEIGSRRWVADGVELAALILEAGGQPQPSARLMGACAAIRTALGEPAGGLRALAATVQACRARLAGALGDGCAEQETIGAAYTIEQAIAYALEWLEPPGGASVLEAASPTGERLRQP